MQPFGILVSLVGLLSLTSCSTFPADFTCTRDDQCVRQNNFGYCITNACAFDDLGCRSGLSYDSTAPADLAGRCVPSGADRDSGTSTDSGTDGGLLNDCGGSTTLPGRIFDPCGACLLGHYECETAESLACVNDRVLREDITGDGSVTASSTYGAAYIPARAVDGDPTTSWFSDGPEGGGMPTTYEWTIPSRECIVGISFRGNALHPEFSEDFGFGSMTVQVLDAAGGVQFSQVESLPGTPDPNVNVDLDANGVKVRLLFTDHESTDCGGFAELAVTVAR